MRLNFVFTMLLASLIMAGGCAPRVRIKPSPGPNDSGIRYYRPKPYLRIEPAGSIATEGKVITTTPSDEYVAITLEYLPDFSEEYAIDVRPGLGSANVSVGLTDGWNLTSLNQELDSQFDENVKAVAELAKATTGFIPTAKSADDVPPRGTQKFVVASTNVPIGYYESVISKDACGKKRLFGWRYIGFLPFNPCPVEMCGSQRLACQNVPSDLFGIVFENGVMTFRRLDAISEIGDANRTSVSTGQFISQSQQQKLDVLARAVKRAILVNEGTEANVGVRLADDAVAVELDIELVGPVDDNTTRARLIKRLVEHESVETALHDLGDPVPNIARIAGLPLE